MTATLRLGNDLLRSAARLNRWASRHASLGVPHASARLLALLDELGPTRVGDLALADHSSQPTATAAVQRLEAEGWVERAMDPADGRASLVRLTPAGRDALERVRVARASVLAPVLEEFELRDPAAIERVEAAVAVITELLDISAHRQVARTTSTPTFA